MRLENVVYENNKYVMTYIVSETEKKILIYTPEEFQRMFNLMKQAIINKDK